MQTLTFYSYKGGVGRTLMVANMARYLASFGQKVVAVDFDLEAPGLHYKLGVESPERGLVDLLDSLFGAGEIPEPLAPYVVTVQGKNDAGGSIHLIPAGAAPSPAYWRQLAKLDWHWLFYSEEAPGVPLFLELQERIAREYEPDFLLIDSRTGITEVGGATTTLLADRVICLLLNNRENLDGAREVLRSLRRAPRLPEQAPLEIWPVLSRIPEVGGQKEADLVREVREFLGAETEDLVSTLTVPELFVLHTDPELQLRETLFIGGGKKPDESPLLRDYLALFAKLVSAESLVGPAVRSIAQRWHTDRPSAEKDFAKLAELAPRQVLEPLLDAELARAIYRTFDVFRQAVLTERLDTHALLHRLGLPRPSDELSAAAAAYLDYLVQRHQYLDFRGMGISDRVPLRLNLRDMYVPLKARQEALEEETLARELHKADSRLTTEAQEAVRQRLSSPVPVLDLLREHDGLVLLGDPGSGKTTFLKFLLLTLALRKAEALGLEERLPVYLPLAAWGRELVAGEALGFEKLMAHYYQPVHPAVGKLLAQVLSAGKVLLLLDGLDEVHDRAIQAELGRRLNELYESCRSTGNKFVLTSRIVGYREMRLSAEGLAESTLVDFGAEEIAEFAGKWTAALGTAAAGSSALTLLTVSREREELLAAVHGNPRVEELAANPLLLTILALMKRQGVTLPERRVLFYQACVETLLKSWNLVRSQVDRGARDLDIVETLKVLAPLALWMHETSPCVGLVNEWDLRQELERIYRTRGAADPAKATRGFLEDVLEYAALLLNRGGRQYGFINLALQEYLAAVALVQEGQQELEPVVEALSAHVGEPAWHEVGLLTIGYLANVQMREEAASAVISELLARKPGPPGEVLLLVGRAVVNAGAFGVTPACRRAVVNALLAAIRSAELPAWQRPVASSLLAELADPRLGTTTVGGT